MTATASRLKATQTSSRITPLAQIPADPDVNQTLLPFL
jgi:hypothetical protein